jgi:hypothetical protein
MQQAGAAAANNSCCPSTAPQLGWTNVYGTGRESGYLRGDALQVADMGPSRTAVKLSAGAFHACAGVCALPFPALVAALHAAAFCRRAITTVCVVAPTGMWRPLVRCAQHVGSLLM